MVGTLGADMSAQRMSEIEAAKQKIEDCPFAAPLSKFPKTVGAADQKRIREQIHEHGYADAEQHLGVLDELMRREDI